ncbi:heavy metal translocating P-type ATPase [Herbaspirillum camelliae]|uniref:heavy metal translocating P-type ATPase n=1 Tax=Herbaspirillum camelliae TaxID=1892903 RepID=UPI000ACBC590|nr:heavy metal translocating P-type ATPase [Herbaspirillum camelliae]
MSVSNRLYQAILVFCAVTLAVGVLGQWMGLQALAQWAWLAGPLVVLLAVLADTAMAMRRGNMKLDLIALVSIAGAVLLREDLVAAVIALMFAGGRALEGFAQRRAQEEMSALLGKAPRVANRYEGESIVTIALSLVRPGDRLLVRPGEPVPVDGRLLGPAVVDESMLTGESLPVSHPQGATLASGCVNAGNAFDLLATSTDQSSTFSQVLRLVQAAQASQAPAARMADRYALLFIPLVLAMAALSWLLTGDPRRALAVVVVATPCPLILAVPVAIVCAMSRCAQRGVLIKHGGALEKLAQVHTLFFDKTGTLTAGKARLMNMVTTPSIHADELLRLAASLEQMSNHVIAQAVVSAAIERALVLSIPDQVQEQPGAGLSGRVEGKLIRVGAMQYVIGPNTAPPWTSGLRDRLKYEGGAGVCVAVDGQLCGVLYLADDIRLDTPRALRQLRALGAKRIVMLTGDRRDVAMTIGSSLGFDDVMPEQSPASKLAAIKQASREGVTMMVGDGINDAPALAAADIGVAMGARGAAAAAESAQVVLLVDRLDRLAFGVRMAQQARKIALQSVVAGMGLSGCAMLAAAFGYLPPVAGAILQEFIDVAVILNALRVLYVERGNLSDRLSAEDCQALRDEHLRLQPIIDRLVWLADRVEDLSSAAMREELVLLSAQLQGSLLQHEAQDDGVLYPRLAQLIGGDDPMGSMSSMHREIYRLSRTVDRLATQAPDAGQQDDAFMLEVRRTLYALHAVLRLHFAQEEEIFHGLSA